MKSTALRVVVLSGMATVVAGCVTDQNAAQVKLEQQAVLAVNWVQQSGEYQALAYQAFNTARRAFDTAKAQAGRKKAVIVDLDETMIDNSAYAAWRIEHGVPYTKPTWARWMEAKQAVAIDGAVSFARYVNSHGGRMFYVSNRDDTSYVATVENLQKLGFPGVSRETVLLRTTQSNKQARFDLVKSKGYDVVVYIGDNLNDFGTEYYGKNNRERRLQVAAQQKQFGSKFIMLPNPAYGDWISGMAVDYYKQTPARQLEINRENLRVWKD
ncbi:5'-nucleotidase, lipoprotein e(P4) family [Pseudochrobactrum kiredjianiae]|uniref:5'-nucleotidase, lipoprotein e(P4) family n=1 Tax=Pseudochrobactrum kiredjianiae TaxID=386305 RepID=A0ABW3V9Q3_9HYPH|nr:5'-nucleotidase, lipoprotein e(P4) family [Pseudochrobactrum kiredjianiae]MDM7851495.1 5'-nucleotidase, lipoprotein e(P4) family [Pseudochrobactrum kiredjianiae]